MRYFPGILLVALLCDSIASADDFDQLYAVQAQHVEPAIDESSVAAPEAAKIDVTAAGGGAMMLGDYFQPSEGWDCPCNFNRYWDYTGGRSPTDWICGYGPECHVATARAEWLLWFSKGREAPVLARLISVRNGITDYPSDPIGQNMRNGARITLGHLLADEMTWAEGRFWGVEDGSETFAATAINALVIGQPFLNVTTGQRTTNLISAPGVGAGDINVLSKNDLFGADAWLRRVWWDNGYHRLSFLAGYQFTRMDDTIVIRSSTSLNTGVTGTVQDTFRTQNEFHGGSLGLVSNWRRRWLSLEALMKVGLGDMRQTAIIAGETRLTAFPSGATATLPVGFLAQTSNIGMHTRHQFAAIPELNVNGVIHISPRWQGLIGYSILYWNNTLLAGREIDTRVNTTQFPPPTAGAPLPAFSFNRGHFWVQGLSLGLERRW